MDIDYKVVGERVRNARIARGLTSEELSEKVNLASESLRHIETGSSKPSLRKLCSIAVALDVSLDYLVGRTPSFEDEICSEFGKAHNLTDWQMKMLRDLIDDVIPTITKYV